MLQKLSTDGLKNKESQMQTQLDEAQLNYQNEKNTNANLNLKIENLLRQDQIYSNLISTLKTRILELEAQLNEYSMNEPDLRNKLIEANDKVSALGYF